jgi:hypothetical protein
VNEKATVNNLWNKFTLGDFLKKLDGSTEVYKVDLSHFDDLWNLLRAFIVATLEQEMSMLLIGS